MLGLLVQKITLAQKKTLGHTMCLFAIDLMNCSLGTAGTFLFAILCLLFSPFQEQAENVYSHGGKKA